MAFNFREPALDIIPNDVADLPLKHWNKGVFNYELIAQRLVSRHTSFELLQHLLLSKTNAPSHQLSEGTYAGTQLALTETFDRIEQGYNSWFNVLGVEANIPRPLSLEEKKNIYTYQAPTKDRFPPHLDTIPTKDQANKYEIFDKLGLVQANLLIPKIIPKTLVSQLSANLTYRFREWMFGDPEQGITIAEIEHQNKENRKSGTDIMRGANIGDLDDWFTDARFAQQYLTGTNPIAIQLISEELLAEFRQAAADQGLGDITRILEEVNQSSLYVADCRFFREALGLNPHDPIVLKPKDTQESTHYGCASVTLFQLHHDGDLHPLAIVIDYRATMKESVVLFNSRSSPGSDIQGEEWSWRYSKTCAQSSDWTLHEMAVHLTHTHFIEEAIIVATHRCIPFDNIVYQLLEAHWFRTLSLNAGGRETLLPQVILQLVSYSTDQGYNFIQHAYDNFDFQAKYIPRDLQDRGFPIAELDSPKFRNCAYARNMALMWSTIQSFVSSMIALHYKTDAQVANDRQIRDWCKEIQSDSGARLKSFPTICTVDDLVDAITMCIHIASPQHSAVNYLQSFYYTFVINKPPCLFQPLPETLEELKAVKEPFLVKSLPIGHQRYWLLAAQVSWLLSFRPADDNNLINYAASLWNLYKNKGEDEKGPKITKIAADFYADLRNLILTFEKQSNEMGEKQRMIPYRVLDPRNTAVSILI